MTPRMTSQDLLPHKQAIQAQAIGFYKSPNVFAGHPRMERWRFCIRLVADAWMTLGPQVEPSGPVILLPCSAPHKTEN